MRKGYNEGNPPLPMEMVTSNEETESDRRYPLEWEAARLLNMMLCRQVRKRFIPHLCISPLPGRLKMLKTAHEPVYYLTVS